MVKWNEDLAEKGLVVIGIFDGSKDREKAKVEEHLKDKKVVFPVAYDADGKTTKEFGIMAFPTAYLIDVDGKVAWEGPPLKKVADIEALFEKELARVKKKGK